MAADDLLVFVHIPKSAGTALNTWLSLSHHYGNLYVKVADSSVSALRWTDVSPVDLADRRLRSVASHHLRTYPPSIHGRRLRYITILRNPIAWWVSHVRFFHKLEASESQPRRSLREYAEWILDQPELTMLEQLNGQTNFIAEHEWFRLNRRDDMGIDWKAEGELFERYRRERFDLAKATLHNFDALGTVERLDDFTQILQAKAPAWDVPLIRIDGLNPTHVTQAPPVDASWINAGDSVGKRLLDAFAEDFELHRLAGERLAADLAQV
jgi:hypothetical protein